MVIRVNISELESKAKYAESLSIQLKIKEDEINSIYYSLDLKVKSRNGIGQSMISLQKRIEEAQQKMYNISKFLYSAADNYRKAEEQIVSNSKRFEDRQQLYDEQYSDYNYIKNLNIFEGANIEEINSANNVEMDSRVIDYLKKSGNQLILGNYTEDVTLLGTLMQVGTGLLGVDLPMDLRDILYDFTHWKWSWEHAGKAGMDLLSVFPIIGGLKYTDEASSLAKAAFKNTDEASALMKGALKNTDEASTLIKGSLKSSDEISDIAKGVDKSIEVATRVGSNPESIPKRPSWRQSELDVQSDFPEYNPQKSFIDGEEVPYGTKGSSRPDFYKEGASIEVKNYKVTTSEGRSRLINNISNQVNKRITDLPNETSQTIIIDIRGQNVSNDVLRDIRDKILEKSNVNVNIQFKR